MNAAKNRAGTGGSYTNALAFGGDAPPLTAATEYYDGTSWTEVGDLSDARSSGAFGGGAPTGISDAILAGGNTPGNTDNTEEWSAPTDFQKQVQGQLFYNSTADAFKETITDVPAGSWSSGSNYPISKGSIIGAGTATAGLAFGGSPGTIAETYEYDGSSWTEGGDLNTGRSDGVGVGTQTSALGLGGQVPSAYYDRVEQYNGSSWTEIAEFNTARSSQGASGLGTVTDTIMFAGNTGSQSALAETWDGTTWTEVSDLNTARYDVGGAGASNTSAICFAGGEPSRSDKTESWNGSSWTEVGDLNETKDNVGAAGDAGAAIAFGGATPSLTANTEAWNGSAWAEVGNLGTARSQVAGSGSVASALATGGESPSVTNATEQWSGPLANKTITTS
jgi:hypothetical protein